MGRQFHFKENFENIKKYLKDEKIKFEEIDKDTILLKDFDISIDDGRDAFISRFYLETYFDEDFEKPKCSKKENEKMFNKLRRKFACKIDEL